MVTLLQSPFVVEVLLPFLLVFVVVFGILQKTKIFGDGKKQIDSIVALVVGLIVVAFGYAVGIIVQLIPIMAIVAVVILVFMILYGMAFQGEEFKMNKYLTGGIGIIVGIVVIISVLVLTGAWQSVLDYYYTADSGAWITNIVFILIVVGAILAVVLGGKGSGGDGDKGKE